MSKFGKHILHYHDNGTVTDNCWVYDTASKDMAKYIFIPYGFHILVYGYFRRSYDVFIYGS